MFPSFEIILEAILSNHVLQREGVDKVAWTGSSNGVYSAKSGYHLWFSVHFGIFIGILYGMKKECG